MSAPPSLIAVLPIRTSEPSGLIEWLEILADPGAERRSPVALNSTSAGPEPAGAATVESGTGSACRRIQPEASEIAVAAAPVRAAT